MLEDSLSFIVLVCFIGYFLFAGEPDIRQALICNLTHATECTHE